MVDVPFLLGIAYGGSRLTLPDVAERAQSLIDAISRAHKLHGWPARLTTDAERKPLDARAHELLRRAVGVVSDVARLQTEAAAVLDAYAAPASEPLPPR